MADKTQIPDPAFAPPESKVEIRPNEAKLHEVAKSLPGKSIVVLSNGRAQSAAMLASERPKANVTAWYLDGYRCDLAQQYHSATPENLNFVCDSDWALSESSPQVDLVCLAMQKGGEAELNRDILQTAYHNLVEGGALVTAINNPKDKWLIGQMQGFDKSVKVRKFKNSIVYYIIKKKPLKKLKDFSAQIAFRDEGNLIQIVTRPGVFAHRQFDNGARQILTLSKSFPNATSLK